MPINIYGENNPQLARFVVLKDTTVWRYMDIAKYLDLITKGKLWFTRAIEFRKTDPYEGALTVSDQTKTKEIIEAKGRDELKATLIRHHELGLANMLDKVPERSFYFFQLLFLLKLPLVEMNSYTNSISCWHQNTKESDAMWALYAHRDAGIAIKSSVGRIIEAFKLSDRNMTIAKVLYDSTDDLSALTSGVHDSLLIKRHAFHHENEVRITALTMDGYESPQWTPDNQVYNVDRLRHVPPGFYIECDLLSLIEEVVISPLMASYGYEALEVTTKAILPSTPFRRSNLLVKPEIPGTLSKELSLMLAEYNRTMLVLDIDQITPPT